MGFVKSSEAKLTLYRSFHLLLISFSVASASALTAYQVLEEYDFPDGLLPKGVLGYELDRSTGKFKAYLNGTCSFRIESYSLEYKSTITGVITKDKLSRLSGIKVKVLILWVDIVTVTRRDDQLQFSVGIASADFPVNNFYYSPTCGCGFDCLNMIPNQTQTHPPVKDFVLSS